jgi:hypothetical protein
MLKKALVIHLLLGTICLLVLMVGACKDDVEKTQEIRRRIADISSEYDPDALANLCSQIGEECFSGLLQDVEHEKQLVNRLRSAEVLLAVDVNRYLLAVAGALDDSPEAPYALGRFLRGRMNKDTRRILQAELPNMRNGGRVIGAWILMTICDDLASYEVAKTVLQDESLTEKEVVALLCLLGNAAYYNNVEGALVVVAPFLEDGRRDVRLSALITLPLVPGKAAEDLFVEVSGEEEWSFKKGWVEEMLERRTARMNVEDRIADGWSCDSR